MANWQYNPNAENRPHVPVDRGHAVNIPHTRANEKRHTAWLEDTSSKNGIYLWIHQIESSFEIGGGFAQSANKADWHPRNFVQPRFKVTGQTASQFEYARISEFIRVAQNKAIRDHGKPALLRLKMHGGGVTRHVKRTNYDLFGYVEAISRRHERFNFGPDFSFEFIVAYAHQGLFTQGAAKHTTLRKLGEWMDIFKGATPNTFQDDPDTYYLPDSYKSDSAQG